MKRKMIVAALIASLSMSCSFTALAGWQQDSVGWWYVKEDGSNTYAVGDALIEGAYYWFNDSGYMQTGWKSVSGYWKYYDADGKRASGWREVDGKWYYFDNDGRMQTGWLDLDGNRYFLRNDGMVIGDFEDGQYQYQTDESGAIYRNKYIDKDFKYDENGALMYRGKNTGMQWEPLYSTERMIDVLKESYYERYVNLNLYSTRGDFEKAVREGFDGLTSLDDIDEFIDYVEEEYDIKYGKRSGHYYSSYTDYNSSLYD